MFPSFCPREICNVSRPSQATPCAAKGGSSNPKTVPTPRNRIIFKTTEITVNLPLIKFPNLFCVRTIWNPTRNI